MAKPLESYRDYETIPFRYDVHAMQHNERMIARLFEYPKEAFTELSEHQSRVRFANPLVAEPQDLLWVNAKTFPFARLRSHPSTKQAWLSAFNMVGNGVLIVDQQHVKKAYKVIPF